MSLHRQERFARAMWRIALSDAVPALGLLVGVGLIIARMAQP